MKLYKAIFYIPCGDTSALIEKSKTFDVAIRELAGERLEFISLNEDLAQGYDNLINCLTQVLHVTEMTADFAINFHPDAN